jgi:hypothetical protein
MKVRDLIQKLNDFDPETIVVVGGFDEEGFANIERVEMVSVIPRKSQAEIFGEYQESTQSDKIPAQKVLLLDHN